MLNKQQLVNKPRKKQEKNFLENFNKKEKKRNNDILLFIKPYRGFF